jgi:hypothetical protein
VAYREKAALARLAVVLNTNEERRSCDRRMGHSIEQPRKIWKRRGNVHKKNDLPAARQRLIHRSMIPG